MESKENAQPTKRRTVLGKIANVISYILVIVVFLIILITLSLQLAPVQNFVRGKAQSFLQNKLKTKVLIGKLDVDFPSSVLLKNIYIEDQTRDTLLSGGQLKVDINMLGLLKGDIQIKEINVDQLMAKIKRVGTDTVFNYQFITDAFAGSDTSTSTDTSAIKMDIDNIVINRTRIVFKDVLTGNDMDMYITHFDAPIETFDINKMYFDIPTFTLTGLRGYFHQNNPLKPVIEQAVADAVNTPGTFLQLKNSEINLKDIDFTYKSQPTSILTTLKINSFTAHPDTLNIRDGKFNFKDLDLNNADIGVVMSNKEAPLATAKEAAVEKSLPLFTITSDKTIIANSHIKMDNTSMPVLKEGMDYGHMDMTELNLAADNLIYNSDTISALITSGSMKEKSGLVLNELNADFLFTDKKTSLQNFLIKTPGSTIRNKALITYPSLAQLAANPDLLNFDLNFVSTSVLVKDLLLFAPMLKAQPAFANPSQTLMVNGRVFGKVSDLNFQDLRFIGFGNTTVFVTGSVKGLPDPNKFSADLTINRLITSRKDIMGLLPPGTLPANITLPESIDASGTVKGNMNNLASNLTVKTSLGSAQLNGTLTNFSSPTKARYDYAITATSINLGTIMGDPKTFGVLSGNFKVKGAGLDPNVANATFSGVLNTFGYNQYTYKNVKLNGSIANKNFKINADINDPNIDLDLAADG
ncbi:MAG: AsmA family protein, partial [Ginsengibacter sp.]